PRAVAGGSPGRPRPGGSGGSRRYLQRVPAAPRSADRYRRLVSVPARLALEASTVDQAPFLSNCGQVPSEVERGGKDVFPRACAQPDGGRPAVYGRPVALRFASRLNGPSHSVSGLQRPQQILHGEDHRLVFLGGELVHLQAESFVL